jgi:Predicted membrane protein
MHNKPKSDNKSSFLFQVEILTENDNNAAALEELLRMLNGCGFADYRITSGIRLGHLIEERLSAANESVPIPIAPAATDTAVPEPAASDSAAPEQAASGSAAPSPAAPNPPVADDGFEGIRKYMKSNTLVRLLINRGFGVSMNIPCRIINMDESERLITAYHVDEKQVYTFRMNEIEDIVE